MTRSLEASQTEPVLYRSNVVLVVEPCKIIFPYKLLYPKRRMESYSIMGTIVSPNKILLTCFGGLDKNLGVPLNNQVCLHPKS